MNLRRLVPLTFCLVLVTMSSPPRAGISYEPFGLWEFEGSLSSRVLALDFDPETPGIETLNVNSRSIHLPFTPTEAAAGGGPSLVRRFYKIRIDVYDALGETLLRSFEVPTLVSAPFINPNDPTYGVEGTQPTFYFDDEGGAAYDPRSGDFPVERNVGFGFGWGEESVRVLVLGLGFGGGWSNPALKASDELREFAVIAWDADNGELLWQRAFPGDEPGTPQNWEIFEGFSGVGDFLTGDGVAEVRVVQDRGLAYGGSQQKWRYFDLVTGDLLWSKIVTVPRP
jgi:hypothetical protein